MLKMDNKWSFEQYLDLPLTLIPARMHSKWAKENADIILPLWNFSYVEANSNSKSSGRCWNMPMKQAQ